MSVIEQKVISLGFSRTFSFQYLFVSKNIVVFEKPIHICINYCYIQIIIKALFTYLMLCSKRVFLILGR